MTTNALIDLTQDRALLTALYSPKKGDFSQVDVPALPFAILEGCAVDLEVLPDLAQAAAVPLCCVSGKIHRIPIPGKYGGGLVALAVYVSPEFLYGLLLVAGAAIGGIDIKKTQAVPIVYGSSDHSGIAGGGKVKFLLVQPCPEIAARRVVRTIDNFIPI